MRISTINISAFSHLFIPCESHSQIDNKGFMGVKWGSVKIILKNLVRSFDFPAQLKAMKDQDLY